LSEAGGLRAEDGSWETVNRESKIVHRTTDDESRTTNHDQQITINDPHTPDHAAQATQT
jgi:hypothetical protein